MKKYLTVLLTLLFVVACDEKSETDISGSISVDSITPAPGSELPPLGEKVTFTFENIIWDLENKDENKEVDIAVWFLEVATDIVTDEASDSTTGNTTDETKDKQISGKLGWQIFSTTKDSGVKTISLEMPSWNHTNFSKKPTTLSIAICESKKIVGDLIKSCAEVTATETYEYQ